MKYIRFGRFKLLRKIRQLLKSGVTPERLALSVSLGITIGIIPLVGITTALLALLAYTFRLNLVATQVVHYIVHPIQIALFIPFFKLGELFHEGDMLPSSFGQFLNLAKTDLWGLIQDFWLVNLSAIIIWLIISIPLAIILYRTLLFSFRKLALVIAK